MASITESFFAGGQGRALAQANPAGAFSQAFLQSRSAAQQAAQFERTAGLAERAQSFKEETVFAQAEAERRQNAETRIDEMLPQLTEFARFARENDSVAAVAPIVSQFADTIRKNAELAGRDPAQVQAEIDAAINLGRAPEAGTPEADAASLQRAQDRGLPVPAGQQSELEKVEAMSSALVRAREDVAANPNDREAATLVRTLETKLFDQRTTGTVIVPLLDKLVRGEQLDAGEQAALDAWKNISTREQIMRTLMPAITDPGAGTGGTVPVAPVAEQASTAPAVPTAETLGTADNPHVPTSLEDMEKIPSGAVFKNPATGTLMVKK